jgi:hypothetical protein
VGLAHARRRQERALDDAELRAKRTYARTLAAQPLGLSTCHIGPQYWAEVAPKGSYLAVRSKGTGQCQKKTSSRSKVVSFTKRSRSRMLKHFATLDRSLLSTSLLVTLTYPRLWSADSCTYRRHFHLFSKRLLRTYPRSSATWKLEFQTRGAPHYHLIVTGVSYLDRAWLSRAWYEVVGSDDPRHLSAGTQVERCDSARQALSYAAKYVAKVSTGAPATHSGRFWGVVGRRNLDKSVLRWPLDARGHARLSRTIRNLVGSRSKLSQKRRRMVGWCFVNGARAVAAVTVAAGLRCSPVTVTESHMPTLAPWHPTGAESATWWRELSPSCHVAVAVLVKPPQRAHATRDCTADTRSVRRNRRGSRRQADFTKH